MTEPTTPTEPTERCPRCGVCGELLERIPEHYGERVCGPCARELHDIFEDTEQRR